MTVYRYRVHEQRSSRHRIPTNNPGDVPPWLLFLAACGLVMFGCCWCGFLAYLVV